VKNSNDYSHRRRSRGGRGSGLPQIFGCGVLYGLDLLGSHEMFDKIYTRSGFVSLQNVLNRQIAGVSPRTPLWELIALPRTP